MTRRLIRLALIAFVIAIANGPRLHAALDFSGAWSGTITFPAVKQEPSPAYGVFQHNGANFTGTFGPDAKAQVRVANGRVETTAFGTSIMFDVTVDKVVMHVMLRPAEDVLRGTARVDTSIASAPLELRRVK